MNAIVSPDTVRGVVQHDIRHLPMIGQALTGHAAFQ
jgi:hypothetical protein